MNTKSIAETLLSQSHQEGTTATADLQEALLSVATQPVGYAAPIRCAPLPGHFKIRGIPIWIIFEVIHKLKSFIYRDYCLI
jgi:hypothetical protein